MPINTREIISIVADLSRNENLRVSIGSSVRGALIAGGSTLAGGLLLGGPIGLAVGGLLGVVTNATTAPNFRPVADILLNDLTLAQQATLINRVNSIIRNIDVMDLTALSVIILSNKSIENQLLSIIRNFVTTDLQLQLI
ncbi:hypothetical protein PGB90_003821 [Kerria lacca]